MDRERGATAGRLTANEEGELGSTKIRIDQMMKRLIVSAAALALSTGAALTQPEAVPYCPDLKHVILLAASNDKFASIRAEQRDGNFWGTSLPLTGWKNCSIYGSRNYTCDSEEVTTAAEAERSQARIVNGIKACLDDTWTEDKQRSSSSYALLHHPVGFVSMTVSTDEIGSNAYVVRLIVLLRSNS